MAGPPTALSPTKLGGTSLATTGGIQKVASGWAPDGRRPQTKPLYCSVPGRHYSNVIAAPPAKKNPSAPRARDLRIHHPDTRIGTTTIMTRLRDGSRNKMAFEPPTFVTGSILGNEAVSRNFVLFFYLKKKNFPHS